MTQSSPVTLTLERGLKVLRAFRAERVPLTNSELVRRTGLSKSTVSRLTMTLVGLGFLRRVAGGPQFELAGGPLGIGHAYLETNAVTRLAHPFMQQLADRLNASVALAVPNQLDMLYIAYRTSTRIATLRLGVGSLLPMGLTAIGRAWLWGLPKDARADYVASVIEAAGPQAGDIRKNIEAAFDDLRETGVCMSVGEYQRNAYGIALPLSVGRAGMLMALNCGAVELRPDVESIRASMVPELKAAAVELMVLLRDVGTEA
ncbi:IclR family transcriptional regulator [Cupriavidus basilensis]|uniref:Transcriptional regulator, IclR family n=1 Tax=Cupriavidus basilensis TaxID=68895 RepID=A0A0C4YAA5_9BURK|nr:IclR family transcriptional regulator [Cupriavidus basilensis]AJG22427.1 Transcriptional regulator, IclR family [Cupriavidus basilensis]